MNFHLLDQSFPFIAVEDPCYDEVPKKPKQGHQNVGDNISNEPPKTPKEGHSNMHETPRNKGNLFLLNFLNILWYEFKIRWNISKLKYLNDIIL